MGTENRGSNKKDSEKGRHPAVKLYLRIMLALYGVAVLTCLICNLVIEHRLSWFYIVLFSIGIAFSVTILPVLVKKHRVILSALGVTLFTFLLLYACNLYTGGDWLYRYAFPIAAFPVAAVWLMILTAKIKGMNWFFKSAFISLLAGILIMTLNTWVDAVLSGKDNLVKTFVLKFNPTDTGYLVNTLIGICFVVYFFIGIWLGISKREKNRLRLNEADASEQQEEGE